MPKTLYDFLEVSQSASQETIAAAYQRMHARLAANMDVANEDVINQMTALREAFGTLSDPERRRRYDSKLALREMEPVAVAPTRSFRGWIILALILAASGLLYTKYQSEREKARLERERIAAESKAAELALQKQVEEIAAAEEAERQRLREEALERFNQDRDRAYANQVARSAYVSEQRTKREEQQEAQKRAFAERQQQLEAERRVLKEKAYLRQLEAENARPARYWVLSK